MQGRPGKRLDWITLVYGLGLTAFLLVVFGQATNAIYDYPVEFLLCFINGGLSIWGQLLSVRREASIHFISFFFCFLFMSAAPIVQFGAYNATIFGVGHLALWAAANALVFTSIGIFYTYRLKTPENEAKTPARRSVPPSGINYFLVFATTIFASATAIVLFRNVLFTSRTDFYDETLSIFGDAPTAMLATTFLLSTPLFAAIIGLRASIASRNAIWTILFSGACVMAAVPNNPVIQPRYQLAGLAFFLIDYMFYGKKTKALVVLLIAGVLLGPAFQSFRHSDPTDQSSFSSDENKLVGETLLAMDYDAFSMSCYTVLTVENDGISWGSNIVGAVLFFVPRALWPGKPPPTSWVIYDMMSHFSDVRTDNLSTPLMAEGYYAFGWLGALGIGVLYWWLVSGVIEFSREKFDSWLFLFRCVFAGLVLIILRGTLTVGVSALASYCVAAAIPLFLIRSRFGIPRSLASTPERHASTLRTRTKYSHSPVKSARLGGD
ncbi:hypothetical protein [Bradyrhizobium canariense]|uniref:Oligosaccharide repeat unit polymerase n=1 Tax=Bradyrhizobium canariense TaxID=255045 RepID=A0A1H2BNA9_9BRAD|nr:hypothetical protein [Bradyrhizobium canariense]SDT59547.1 hypothetical protein SAMN05444158_7354 [Bradyrhizobium canariense]